MFTLKQIDGAVVPKKERITESGVPAHLAWTANGFNQAIDAQSSVRLRLNREKLAKVLYQQASGRPLDWPHSKAIQEQYYAKADAIIASDKEIIEVEP